MKGKLNKQGDRWVLYNEDSSKIALSTESPFYKLSLKNCESIANGYDLMMLAEEDSNKYYDVKTTDWHCNYNGFFGGFQKALEILGDKKFSEEDMGRIMVYGYDKSTENEYLSRIPFDEYIRSLQQTQWDVEIVTKPYIEVSEGFNLESKREPTLDADSCLILKRI